MNERHALTSPTDTRSQVARPPERIARLIALLSTVAFLAFGGMNATAQPLPNPCDSMRVDVNYKGPGCCWEFILQNNQSLQPVNAVTATVITPAASVVSASGGFSITSTSTNINWQYPNNIPKGATKVGGCFQSASGVISLVFEWKFQNEVVCRDTVRIDCPLDPGDDSCDTDSLLISTGWNPYSGSLHAPGQYTTFWQVIADPSPNTTEPRPASVITKHTAWSGPLGTSQWISSYPSANNDTNGTYVFQTCFCVKDGARNVRLIFDILADDRARVYLNGVLIGSTPTSGAFQNPATHIDTNITQIVKPGRNCIKVEVDNTNNVAMGLDLSGYITADGIGLERSACCDPGGTLTGMKFFDQNCNGKKDAGEPGLAGWTIILSNGDTATTDALGNYYFNGLAPGSYTVQEVNQAGWSQSYPTAPGTHTVNLTQGQAIGNLDFGNCRDTKPQEGCIEYRADTTLCISEPGTNTNMFRHKFRIRSLLPCQFSQNASVTVLSPAGVGVAPPTFPVSSSWSSQSIVINGPGATPGTTVVLQVQVCCVAIDPNGNVGDTIDCCFDTIRVTLPDCGPVDDCKDCCREFPKKFGRLFQWTSSNGSASIGGSIQAGNSRICTVSATIVEARINGQPVSGEFVPVSLLGGSPGNVPFMHEVVWTGVDVNAAPTAFNLQLRFPGIAWNAFTDRVDYCVRFRFTDKNCVTCDTVVCFRQQRYRWIFPFPGTLNPGRADDEKRPGVQSGAPSLSGTLTGPEAGRLDITFPEPPKELGDLTYVGLEIYPAAEFVEITEATGDDYTFTTDGFGAVSVPFSAEPGSSTGVDLKYFGLNNRSRLDHHVTFRFVLDASPADTLSETGIVPFTRVGFTGGDELEQDAHETDAKTFALYLHNRNGSEEPISRLALQSDGGTDILAIGPGTDPKQVVASIADATGNATDAAGIDLSGISSNLGAGETLGPIYVTVIGFSGSTDLNFTTLNGDGAVVSEGTITLSETPSGIHTTESANSVGGIQLYGGFPNPVSDGTTIRFRLADGGEHVTLSIVDESGREVERLLDESSLRSGEHALWFETSDLPSGNYFVRLTAGSRTETGRLQVLR